MRAWIESWLLPLLDRFQHLAVAHPTMVAVYLALLVPLVVLTVVAILWQRTRLAYWSVVFLILVSVVFSWGDDSYTHVYRIVALAKQLRGGTLDLLLTNPTTDDALPVFVYYGILPYVVPVALNLAGLSAMVAFKCALILHFLVMAVGLQALVDRTAPQASFVRRRSDAGFLVAILFLTANYVFTLWYSRASLAELFVYSLIPWVIGALLKGSATRLLTILLFLQMAAHPIVLLQSLICELAVPFALARLTAGELLRRIAGPFVLALMLASPFWLPQALWAEFIVGPTALPKGFADSFGPLWQMVHPRDFRSVGPWLPLAAVLMIATAPTRLPARIWLLSALALGLFAVQSIHLRDLVVHVPVLNLSMFVWRLMMPLAFIGFALLLAAQRSAAAPPAWGLAVLAALSVMVIQYVPLMQAPQYFPMLAKAGDDERHFTQYDRGEGIWGVREFQPNYASLPTHCGVSHRATFAELRQGVKADQPYLTVHNGPIGIVTYEGDGRPLPTYACGDMLVLGPIKPGSMVRVSETWLDRMLYLRAIELVAGIVLLLVLFLNHVRPGRSPRPGLAAG